MSQNRFRVVSACVGIACVLVAGPVQADDFEAQLPNLKPIPPFDLQIGDPDSPDQGDRALRFSISTMNVGQHALELFGDPAGSAEELDAYQCVIWTEERLCDQREPVGTMAFHLEHLHWHFQDFARYELRVVVDDEVDMSPNGLVAGGDKVSFCLVDSGPAEEGPRDHPRWYVGCLGALQGITPGWQDTYHHGLPDQQIIIDAVPDGVYELLVRINPEASILETDSTDNVSGHRLRLLDGGTRIIPIEDDEPIIPE